MLVWLNNLYYSINRPSKLIPVKDSYWQFNLHSIRIDGLTLFLNCNICVRKHYLLCFTLLIVLARIMTASSEPGGALSDLGMTHSGKYLQSILNGKYAAAEKLMSLRHPDRERLFNLFEEIEVHTEELILALQSEHPVNSDLIENVRCSKGEFDSHKDDWLRKFSDKNNCDSSSSIGTIFNASSRSSVRRRAAEAKRASAKLELEQLSKREQEQKELLSLKAKLAKSKARRRLEAAEVELNVWSEIDDNGHFQQVANLILTPNQMNKVAYMSSNHVGNPLSVLSLAHLRKLRYLLVLYVCQSRHRSLSLINVHNHRIMLLALAFLIIIIRTFILILPRYHKRFPNLNRQTFPLRLLSHTLFCHNKLWLQSLILSLNLNLLKLAILFLKRHPTVYAAYRV